MDGASTSERNMKCPLTWGSVVRVTLPLESQMARTQNAEVVCESSLHCKKRPKKVFVANLFIARHILVNVKVTPRICSLWQTYTKYRCWRFGGRNPITPASMTVKFSMLEQLGSAFLSLTVNLYSIKKEKKLTKKKPYCGKFGIRPDHPHGQIEINFCVVAFGR